MLRKTIFFVILGTALRLSARDFSARELNLFLGGGQNPTNQHGHSVFRTIQLEAVGHSKLADRWLGRPDAGMALSYSDVRQARSWFGYKYGEPDDHIRAEAAYFFLRHRWRQTESMQPFVELGTGPMWSNRRIPAATSRLNFQSQAGLGIRIGANSSHPLLVGYRFAHVSNGGITSRNPGINVNSLWVGTRVRAFSR